MKLVQRIRVEDGTDAPPVVAQVNEKQQLRGIAGGAAGGFFGCMAFLYAASFAASAWFTLIALIVTSGLAFWIGMKYLYRHGVPVAERVMLGLLASGATWYLAIVNMKLNPWITAGARIPLANNVFMEPFPLWIANLCLAVGVLVAGASITGIARYCWNLET